MAKAPNAKKTTAPATTAPAAPAQPWVKQTAPASAPTPAPAEVVTNEKPSETHDALTPHGAAESPHEQAREQADGEGGNGGGTDTEVHSEAVDQLTPTGPSPEVVDAAAEAGTPDNAPERVASEAKDQETPVGEDLSSTIRDQFDEMDEDERAEFEADMEATATKSLERIRRNREARALEMNMVDSQQHYGTRARDAKADEDEADD